MKRTVLGVFKFLKKEESVISVQTSRIPRFGGPPVPGRWNWVAARSRLDPSFFQNPSQDWAQWSCQLLLPEEIKVNVAEDWVLQNVIDIFRSNSPLRLRHCQKADEATKANVERLREPVDDVCLGELLERWRLLVVQNVAVNLRTEVDWPV